MRKSSKVLHTLAASGLIGGLGCQMLLLAVAPQDTPAAYADMRETIAAISNYVLVPSLGVTLVSGMLSMVVHQPFLDKGWVWLKALLGLLMFKGVLLLVVAETNHAAARAREFANNNDPGAALETSTYMEWPALSVIMGLCVANVVLGIWRPRLIRPSRQAESAPDAHVQAEPADAKP